MSAVGDAFIEALIAFARGGVRVKEIVLGENQFLQLALAVKAHDISEPSRAFAPELSFEALSDPMAKVTSTINVGASFEVHGPFGRVTVRQEAKP